METDVENSPGRPQCRFCKRNSVKKEEVVIENSTWYAFVPLSPWIFGHTLLTPDAGHFRNIERVPVKGLRDLQEGLHRVVKLVLQIDNVQRAYVAVLGESPGVHFHYHVVPRYRFRTERERIAWSRKFGLTRGPRYWRIFYSRPTRGFGLQNGFQYLREMEESYNRARALLSAGKPPPEPTRFEIARRLRRLVSSEHPFE